ncbi:Copia protein isoform B [Glycine soja]|uniref:Copia protein isoform B n=1 Tax=Glycine soja TaxID=3848 RepID=A0A445KY12_GLYSO|nr:Copia protein isoform B [Glycine soja]
MILVGYHPTGAYRLLEPLSKKIFISRDVVIDEDDSWDWKKKSTISTLVEEENTEAKIIEETRIEVENDRDALQQDQWKAAMEEELRAIERNQIWDLVDLPSNQSPIDVKWIFKLELKQNGSVAKHKARLVARGFLQKAGLDYSEVFALVARLETISNPLAIEKFKERLKLEFEMTDLGLLSYFLGMEFKKANELLIMHQQKYTTDLLKRFQMMSCNPASTPVEPGLKLVKDESEKSVDSTLFKQVVGSLRYLCNTRPDFSFVVSLISRFSNNPKASHWAVAKRILRYLRGTLSYDSDWCGDKVERKSTTSYLFKFLGTSISWCSKKQQVVALSSCEAEYIAACYPACQALWLDSLLEELKVEIQRPVRLYVDNKSTISLVMNPVAHGRSKHIEIIFHFLREKMSKKQLDLRYCSTEMQLIDIFTKGLKELPTSRLRCRYLIKYVALSVILTAAGVLIAALGDFFSWPLFPFFFQTMYLVLVEKSGAEDGLSSLEIMFYNSFLSLPFFMFLIIATGELPNSLSVLFAKEEFYHHFYSLPLTDNVRRVVLCKFSMYWSFVEYLSESSIDSFLAK